MGTGSDGVWVANVKTRGGPGNFNKKLITY